MAAAIDFYAGPAWTNLNGSGLGFYGATFGTSVQVGQFQDSTYITNSAGSAEGPQGTNTKYLGATSVSIDGDAGVHPSSLVLASGALNIRFTFDSAVKTQNGELRIFNRSDIDVGAVGVTTQVCQLVNGGSGVNPSTYAASGTNAGFVTPAGSGTVVPLLSSPASGGLSVSGVDTVDTRHDWYFLISASPDSIGSKTAFGLYVELEYL